MKTLTQTDLENYMTGAVIMGCGGGGGPEGGKELINYAFDRGAKFNLVDINELKKEEMLCIISGVGGGVSREAKARVASYEKKYQSNLETRIKRIQKSPEELSKFIGKEFAAYVPSETGGSNGIMPMFLNALEGKPSIDGDGCGRAKPEIGISLTHVAGIKMAPISVVTPFLEVIIIKDAVDDYRGEDLTRHLAVASGGGVTATRSSGPVKDFKNGIAPNQVTRCMKIGEEIRKARDKGKDSCDAFEKTVGAHKLLEGKVTRYEAEGEGGFNWGNWYIDGLGSYKDKKMKIWYKNENLLSWLNDKQYVTCPDLICVVDSKTSEGLSNFGEANYAGRNVCVYGVKAIDRWRTPKGIEIFGPRHFGFDLDFEPLEKLV